jgi:cold shock CspA family protein
MMSPVASHVGTVRFFYRKKRYGFIEGADGVEYFFPSSTARDLPKHCEGLPVRFDVVRCNPAPFSSQPHLERPSGRQCHCPRSPLRSGVPHSQCNGPHTGTRECHWCLSGIPLSPATVSHRCPAESSSPSCAASGAAPRCPQSPSCPPLPPACVPTGFSGVPPSGDVVQSDPLPPHFSRTRAPALSC